MMLVTFPSDPFPFLLLFPPSSFFTFSLTCRIGMGRIFPRCAGCMDVIPVLYFGIGLSFSLFSISNFHAFFIFIVPHVLIGHFNKKGTGEYFWKAGWNG